MTAIGYLTLVAVLSTATAQNQQQNRDRPQPIPIYYTLQLPKLQDPVPFYNPEISSNLQPPNNYNNVPVVFYEYPTPSQELQPPNPELWNPNNEETYYYPSDLDVEQPTNSHPKKYNKDVHEKLKLSNPKGPELSRTNNFDDLEQRRKTFERFSKAENKKQIEEEKVVDINDEKNDKNESPQEPIAEASDHFDDVEDITTSFTHSLGVRFPGERVQFHMHGHKGPNSYKFGYDTGKGHNRQFRVEERDQNGYVTGQYGYLDKKGKLHMFDYFSDPKGGYTSKKHTTEDRK
ncbi:uncharacterized protein [Onthophagus taurus]|uniref:uncharacterized protein n=1 Tax=Onthophagus taurus TaxID=166361 RepID=UPI0039BE99CD